MTSLAATTNPSGTVARPRRTGAYYAASALYYAGFRGWPLTVMTAIAGRETYGSYDPNSTHIDSQGPQYSSYGPWQIEGSNLEFLGVSPAQALQPVTNARLAYKLAGGNSLSGLGNWALSASPQSGVVPTPTANYGTVNGKATPINYTILPYMPEAIAASQEVGTFGPAPMSALSNTSTWPHNTSSPLPLTAAQEKALGITGGQSPGNAQGCGQKGNLFKVPLGPQITWCEVKALGGGLAIAGGGLMMVVGLALMVVAGLENNGPARVIVQPAQQTVRAVQRRRPRRTPPAAPAAEAA